MNPILAALIAFLAASLRPRLSLQLEIVALRHQLAVYRSRCAGLASSQPTAFFGPGSCVAGRGGEKCSSSCAPRA